MGRILFALKNILTGQQQFTRRFNANAQMRTASLRAALKEQALWDVYQQLTGIVPDITEQYSLHRLDNDYLQMKVRGQHAFQVRMASKAITLMNSRPEPVLVDIGDSSGTHNLYIKSLFGSLRVFSVNLDETAVNKIREKGLEAIHCRAEDIEKYNINPDIYTCFETLEHIIDPIGFLKIISDTMSPGYVVLTVPFCRQSRVGLNYIRQQLSGNQFAENTHIFEFSPADWNLIFRFAGWQPVAEEVYFQYPQRIGRIMKLKYRHAWSRFDYEGFYGVILTADPAWKEQYRAWPPH